MCSLLVPCGSRTHTGVRRGFEGGDLIYRFHLASPEGWSINAGESSA